MPPTLLDALVYHYLTEKGHGDAAKALRSSLGVKREELLTLVAVSGGDLTAAASAFTRAAAARAAAEMADDSDDSDDDDSEDEAAAAARAKAKKKAAKAAAAEAAAAAAAAKAPAAKRKRTLSTASSDAGGGGGKGAGDDWQPAAGSVVPKAPAPKGPRTTNTPFHRVSVTAVEEQGLIFAKELADNTYEGTYGESGWGAKANAILGKVKGKDFRHEKTKKKRGTYRGGTIDGSTSSFKFADD